MGPEHLIAFNVVLLAAMASPGPALLIALRTSIVNGRGAGIATGIGLGLVASLWTLAALVGLEGIFRVFPWAYSALRIGGALYLIWIAWKTWQGARQPLRADAAPARRAFVDGMLVNLGNPKSVLFAAAVLVVVFPAGLTPAEIALVTANHFLVECLVYATLATAFGRPAISRRYLAAKPVLDRVSATVLGALGLRLLWER